MFNLFSGDYDFLNYKHHQYLSNNKPKTVEDLQDWLRKGLKEHDWTSGEPYWVSLASSIYSDLVVDWCVAWLNSCTYKGQPLRAVHTEHVDGYAKSRKITVTLGKQ